MPADALWRQIKNASAEAIPWGIPLQETAFRFIRILRALAQEGDFEPMLPSFRMEEWDGRFLMTLSDRPHVWNAGAVPGGAESSSQNPQKLKHWDLHHSLLAEMLEVLRAMAEWYKNKTTRPFQSLAEYARYATAAVQYQLENPLTFVLARYLFAFECLRRLLEQPGLNRILDIWRAMSGPYTRSVIDGFIVYPEPIDEEGNCDWRVKNAESGVVEHAFDWYMKNEHLLVTPRYWKYFVYTQPEHVRALPLLGPASEHLPEKWASWDFDDGGGALEEWRIVRMAQALCRSKTRPAAEKRGATAGGGVELAENPPAPPSVATIRNYLRKLGVSPVKSRRGHPGRAASDARNKVPDALQFLLDSSGSFPLTGRRLSD